MKKKVYCDKCGAKVSETQNIQTLMIEVFANSLIQLDKIKEPKQYISYAAIVIAMAKDIIGV